MQIASRAMTFQVPTFPPLPTPAPTPAPAPVPNDRHFANLLQRSQPVRPAPLPAPVAAPAEVDRAAAPKPADDGATSPDEATPAQRQRLAPKAPARGTTKAPAGPAADEAQAARSRATDEAAPDSDAAPTVPDTTTWQVPLPPPPTTMPAGGAGREALPAGSDDLAAAAAPGGAGPRGRVALPATDDTAALGAAAASSAEATAETTAEAAAAGNVQALESALELATAEATDSGAGTPALPLGGPTTPNSFATLLAGAGPQGGTREAAPTATATLPTPTTAPEFAQSLGVQVSVFARDGVQQAELHLNPAETGPVSVQIVLDGTQARVDFGADLAATRSAIEAGLPELAAALREAGFTLSGGGVSQHAGGRGDTGASHGDGGSARGRHDAADDPVARPLRSRASAGGVDLYA